METYFYNNYKNNQFMKKKVFLEDCNIYNYSSPLLRRIKGIRKRWNLEVILKMAEQALTKW